MNEYQKRSLLLLLVWLAVVVVFVAVGYFVAAGTALSSGLTSFQLIALVAGTMAVGEFFTFLTHFVLARRKRPPVEGHMIGKLYRFGALLAVAMSIAFGFGKLATVGTLFGAVAGMLLGWSLQAPVSGMAAWALVSVKRPIRPGDRVSFPNLGLVGDVKETGLMYTILDQVGGSVGSEEATGRDILVPNAMLFSQVVINYTVKQESAYMLDEVIIRITYDSDWEKAEQILLNAAKEITADIIATTGMQPYIRSDLYDYGVYLRLRYQTAVKGRVEIAYEITKKVFTNIQKTPAVDLAIPFVYSYRAGAERKEDESIARDRETPAAVEQIEIGRIQPPSDVADDRDIEQLSRGIALQGLLQPIVVLKNPKTGLYDILAGHMRFSACKKLGWKTIPALVRDGAHAAMSDNAGPSPAAG